MAVIVSKFGGSSLSTGDRVLQVKQFVEQNRGRRYVVVSAPGKRFADDVKVTDLLRRCNKMRAQDSQWRDVFKLVSTRYDKIIAGADLALDLTGEYESIIANFDAGASDAYMESRGEYLMALVMSKVLGYSFIDAAELIKFEERNGFNEVLTYDLVWSRLKDVPHAVIPGYYGSMLRDATNQTIQLFSRGGSDITGAIIARGISADLYENCTDVAGVLACDPKIVPEARTIVEMSFREVRELAYMGAGVLHPDALLPLLDGDIPTRVLDTFNPASASTLITPTVEHRSGSVVGVACRKGFNVLSVTMSSMNSQVGLVRALAEIAETNGVSLEHMPSSLDSVSLIFDGKYTDKIATISRVIREKFPRAEVVAKYNLSLVAVVGEGMVYVPGVLARIASCLAEEGISISMVNQGANEMVILLGVSDLDADHAVRAIYDGCIDKE